jgi:hypothetical protein
MLVLFFPLTSTCTDRCAHRLKKAPQTSYWSVSYWPLLLSMLYAIPQTALPPMLQTANHYLFLLGHDLLPGFSAILQTLLAGTDGHCLTVTAVMAATGSHCLTDTVTAAMASTCSHRLTDRVGAAMEAYLSVPS